MFAGGRTSHGESIAYRCFIASGLVDISIMSVYGIFGAMRKVVAVH